MHLDPTTCKRLFPRHHGEPLLAPDQPLVQAGLTYLLLDMHVRQMQHQRALGWPSGWPWRRWRLN